MSRCVPVLRRVLHSGGRPGHRSRPGPQQQERPLGPLRTSELHVWTKKLNITKYIIINLIELV